MFLLPGDQFIPEMQLTLPGFTYSSCGHLKKAKKEFKIQTNRILEIYLSEQTGLGIFSTRYCLWCVQRSTKKKTFSQSIVQ